MTNRNYDDRKRFRTCIPKDRDEIWQVLTWASEQSRFYIDLRYKYTNYGVVSGVASLQVVREYKKATI